MPQVYIFVPDRSSTPTAVISRFFDLPLLDELVDKPLKWNMVSKDSDAFEKVKSQYLHAYRLNQGVVVRGYILKEYAKLLPLLNESGIKVNAADMTEDTPENLAAEGSTNALSSVAKQTQKKFFKQSLYEEIETRPLRAQ